MVSSIKTILVERVPDLLIIALTLLLTLTITTGFRPLYLGSCFVDLLAITTFSHSVYKFAQSAWLKAAELATGPKKESFNLYSREAAYFSKEPPY